jgi:hypothetical protein
MVLSSGTVPVAPEGDAVPESSLPRQGGQPFRERRQQPRPTKPAHKPTPAVSNVPASHWENRYAQTLVLVDCVVIYLAMLTALLVRFGTNTQAPTHTATLNYAIVSSALGFLWLLMLGGHRAYEPRFLGTGVE